MGHGWRTQDGDGRQGSKGTRPTTAGELQVGSRTCLRVLCATNGCGCREGVHFLFFFVVLRFACYSVLGVVYCLFITFCISVRRIVEPSDHKTCISLGLKSRHGHWVCRCVGAGCRRVKRNVCPFQDGSPVSGTIRRIRNTLSPKWDFSANLKREHRHSINIIAGMGRFKHTPCVYVCSPHISHINPFRTAVSSWGQLGTNYLEFECLVPKTGLEF